MQRAIAHALRDGSDLVWDPRQRPASAPGIGRAARPLNAYDHLEPLASQWAAEHRSILGIALGSETDAVRFTDLGLLPFDQAQLAEGGQIDDPPAFVGRLSTC